MRATGKTTRAIDEAIQKLFTHEVIIVPKTAYSATPGKLLNDKFPVCVDPDYMNGHAQREFLKLLKLRIRNEHPNVHLQEETSVIIFSVNGNSR